jgi:hypothetical protein
MDSSLTLYARSLGRIAFGAAQKSGITGTLLERGAKCISLLRMGKVSNRFLIQGEFWQLCVHKGPPH